MVGVRGMISTFSYTAQDGTRRYKIELLADNVEFMSKRGESSHGGNQDQAADEVPKDAYTDEAADDDELPF